MNPYGKWLLSSIVTFLILFISIFSHTLYFSYLVDPLWNFTNDNKNNTIQFGFDERQQKTNYIANRPMNYDGLLIGTSRVTYMNQSGFENSNVYNYGLSALGIQDYNEFITYAEEENDKNFDQIYFELYYKSYSPIIEDSSYVHPKEAIDNAQSPFYKYTSLFSYDTYTRAQENMEYSLANSYSGFRSYDRSNEVSTSYVNPNISTVFQRATPEPNKVYPKEKVPYNEDYKEILESIQMSHPESDMIPFTDLMTAVRLKAVFENPNELEAYERWFEEMIDVYGQVYSFHSVNEYTIDTKYWFDAVHFYPEIGDILVAHLDGRMLDEDFLTIVTNENLATYLDDLQTELDSFTPNY